MKNKNNKLKEVQEKKVLLEVYLTISQKTGKVVILWDYKEKANAWQMIGVLETIKKELLEVIDEESWKSEGEKDEE